MQAEHCYRDVDSIGPHVSAWSSRLSSLSVCLHSSVSLTGVCLSIVTVQPSSSLGALSFTVVTAANCAVWCIISVLIVLPLCSFTRSLVVKICTELLTCWQCKRASHNEVVDKFCVQHCLLLKKISSRSCDSLVLRNKFYVDTLSYLCIVCQY